MLENDFSFTISYSIQQVPQFGNSAILFQTVAAQFLWPQAKTAQEIETLRASPP